MCGIVGFVSNTFYDVDAMINSLRQRGPDDNYIYERKIAFNKSLGLGMSRLAINDISGGQQPYINSSGSLVVTFNGEIYNYSDLAAELLGMNISLVGRSEIELISVLYANFGIDFIGKLNGMFAISIVDLQMNCVYLARDIFGEKPLFYLHQGEEFLWCSELKALKILDIDLGGIDKLALQTYFQLSYIPAPYSIYSNVRKIEPGSVIKFDFESNRIDNLEVKDTALQDYSSRYTGNVSNSVYRDCEKVVSEAILDATFSDVPFSAFLSGGIDSSIVASVIQRNSEAKIDTYSLGFDSDNFDESAKAKLVSSHLGTRHNHVYFNKDDCSSNLDKILSYFDEPYADSSALAAYQISGYASQNYRVVLTGDGGDEMFMGYNKYLVGYYGKYLIKYPKALNVLKYIKNNTRILEARKDNRSLLFKMNRVVNAIEGGVNYYSIISLGFTKDEMQKLLTEEYSDPIKLNELYCAENGESLFKYYRELDRKISLEGDLLTKVDRMSMSHSLEARSPFLSKKILAFVNSLPDDILVKGTKLKHLLKESFKDHLPLSIINQSKSGFGVPVGDMLRNELKDELLSYCAPKFIHDQGIFNSDYLQLIISNHMFNLKDETFKLWTIFCFQKWYVNEQ